jgi:hypothetical protein
MIWRERSLDAARDSQYIEATSSPAFDVPPDPSGPPRGVSTLLFSSDGSILATLDQSRPNVLWIWSLSPSRLDSILVHESPIGHFTWHSSRSELLVTTNNSSVPAVHLWSHTNNPVIVRVPIARNEAGRYHATWVETPHHTPSTFWFSTPEDCVLGQISLQGSRGEFNLLYSVPK